MLNGTFFFFFAPHCFLASQTFLDLKVHLLEVLLVPSSSVFLCLICIKFYFCPHSWKLVFLCISRVTTLSPSTLKTFKSSFKKSFFSLISVLLIYFFSVGAFQVSLYLLHYFILMGTDVDFFFNLPYLRFIGLSVWISVFFINLGAILSYYFTYCLIAVSFIFPLKP